MSDPRPLDRPPIVEALFDIDCDPAARGAFEGLADGAREAFLPGYPIFRKRFVHQLSATATDQLAVATQSAVDAFQLFSADEKQIVQVRPQGFSFNRLAPYRSF